MMSNPNETLKVLHAPTTVGGNPQSLAKAERAIGLRSLSVTKFQNYLNYQTDIVLYDGSKLVLLVKMLWWGLSAPFRFDVIHYNFGKSFFPERAFSKSFKWKVLNTVFKLTELLDMKWAALVGRTTLATFQGDDARQGSFCREHYPIHFVHEVDESYYNETTDQWKRERIGVIAKHASHVFALNPDLLQVLPKDAKFLPYANVDLAAWNFRPVVVTPEKVLHVIHAPSHQKVKGTQYVLDAVQRLKAEGIEFKFTLIEGLSNQQAKEVYQSADLLIDQLLAGFYGGLSVELMALGTPVICYMRNEDMKLLPPKMQKELPLINATPESVYSVLKQWLTSSKMQIPEKGKQSRRFVERWHDPIKIATYLKQAYQMPKTALPQFDPDTATR